MPGPAQSYLAEFNGYTLPGYVQNESMDSTANIASHPAPYADGSLSEYNGLANKIMNLRLKVWQDNYLSCKEQVQKAATILRSKRKDFATLRLHYTDRYYTALTQTVKMEKAAGTSVKLLEYEVNFECKPWLTSYSGYLISGTGTINTDTKGRTIDDGGWTPTTITVTGTNVTISGYTSAGDFAGFMSISGAVTNMVINSDAMTAAIGGVNANDRMLWVDYRTYVGPGKTIFVIAGASACSIEWNNRWYL